MNLNKRNKELRKMMVKIPIWMIAEGIGVSENTILRWLRQELVDDRKERILEVISLIKSEMEVTKDEDHVNSQ